MILWNILIGSLSITYLFGLLVFFFPLKQSSPKYLLRLEPLNSQGHSLMQHVFFFFQEVFVDKEKLQCLIREGRLDQTNYQHNTLEVQILK